MKKFRRRTNEARSKRTSPTKRKPSQATGLSQQANEQNVQATSNKSIRKSQPAKMKRLKNQSLNQTFAQKSKQAALICNRESPIRSDIQIRSFFKLDDSFIQDNEYTHKFNVQSDSPEATP